MQLQGAHTLQRWPREGDSASVAQAQLRLLALELHGSRSCCQLTGDDAHAAAEGWRPVGATQRYLGCLGLQVAGSYKMAAQARGGPHAQAFRRRSQGSLSRAAQAQMRPQTAKLHDSMHC